MRSLGGSCARFGSSYKSARRKRPPLLLWLAFVAGAFTMMSCGTDVSDAAAVASASGADTSSNQADSEAEPAESQAFTFGSGGGLVTIEGVDYSFNANVCFSQQSGFEASGPGQSADGVPHWVTLSTGLLTREEMSAGGLPQANIDAFFGDKDVMESFTLQVEVGREDAFKSNDDYSLPDFRIDAIDVTDYADLSYTVDGTTLSGIGSVTDSNGAVIDFGDSVPVTFAASCE